MDQGVIHPSVLMKIQTQPDQFIRNFHIPQVSTPKGQSGAFPYLKGSLHSLHRTTSDPSRASSSVLPISPVVIEAPLEKGNDGFSIQRGLAFRMIWAPFERVTFLMQCQNEIIKTGRLSNPYKGIVNCFARTVKNEGIFSLWRGNTACIIEFLSSKALDTADRPLKHKQDKDEFLKRFARKVAVISIDAGAFHYLLYSLLYAHIRLATDMINITSVGVSKRQFSGLIDVCRKTIKTDGIIGLYRGCNILYVKYWLDIAAMHGLVSIMPKFIELLGSQYYSWRPEVVAPVIVTSAWVVTYPLDTIHCRMVMRSGEAVKYKSSFDAFSQTLKTEGVRSLYKGASLLILKNTALGLGFVLGSFSYLEHK